MWCVEMLERVIAAAEHELIRAGVMPDREPVVEHLVAGLHHQVIALGIRQPVDFEREEFAQMVFGQVVSAPGVEIALRSHVRSQVDARDRSSD